MEYIDTEDFEPGGKYGPPAIDVAARRDELAGVAYTTTEDMRKAAELVANKAGLSGGGAVAGDSANGPGGGGEVEVGLVRAVVVVGLRWINSRARSGPSCSIRASIGPG